MDTRYYSWRACRDVGGGEAVIDQETIESVTMLAPYTRTGAIVMEIKHKSNDEVLLHFDGSSLVGANLADQKLAEADLSNQDLSEADLSGADLRRAKLKEANLKTADLRGSMLCNADLQAADLTEA